MLVLRTPTRHAVSCRAIATACVFSGTPCPDTAAGPLMDWIQRG